MDLGIRDKVALVTGSSRGMGKATAVRLAREGCRVAMCARDGDALAAAAEMVRESSGASPFWQVCDLTQPDQVTDLLSNVRERFGTVELLLANTGGPPRGEFLDYSDDDWRSAFESSALALVRLIRTVLPQMLERAAGSIVTITSSSARQPIEGHWISNTLRPGVWGLVKTLSRYYAPNGVRFNNIAPGRINTERIRAADEKRAQQAGIPLDEVLETRLKRSPIGRYGLPEEIADAAAFLLSERASYITGVTLHVDGGMIASL